MAFQYNRLDKSDVALLMVDHQAGLLSLVRDFSPDDFRNNVLALGDIAREALKHSRVTLADRRTRRQGAPRSAVLPVQSSGATLTAGAPASPFGLARIAPWRRWRSCKGLRPFTANAA